MGDYDAIFACLLLMHGPIQKLTILQPTYKPNYTTPTTTPMSIIIKSQQLNILLYRYLQQCNLSHTAFTLYNQANLEQSLLQYKFDVKAGQLVSMIQKALIFAQVESHITMNDYQECKEPFYLLKPHVCKIVERVRVEKEALLEDLNQKVFATMRRTSSVYNTLQPNKDFQEIIYEQRSANFFDRVPLKLADSNQVVLKASRGQISVQKYFCAYEEQTMTITILTKKDNSLTPISILPCRNGLKTFQLSDNLLILVYESNQCQILQVQPDTLEQLLLFKLQFPSESQCKQIKINKKIKNLVTFQAGLDYSIVNVKSKREIRRGRGMFEWLEYFGYLVYLPEEKVVRRFSLKPDEGVVQEFRCPLNQPNKIRVSCSQIYFSVESLAENTVLVYNFDQSQPLYIFNFSQNEQQPFEAQSCQQLHSAVWLTANSTDNLILITDTSIKTFQLQLNNFSKIIEISQYDSQLKHAQILKKTDDQTYLICLGMQNILFYDVSLGKIERVQFSDDVQPFSLVKLDQEEFVGVVAEDRVCVLQRSDLEPLFV